MGAVLDKLGQRKGTMATVVFLATWGLYAWTAVRGTVFGDPSEYQFIPAIWGIAHPPGYAFYTLLAGIWQRLVPIGTIAFRTNLLAGAAGAWTVSRVFLTVLDIARGQAPENTSLQWQTVIAGIVASGALAVTADVWQHSIHANAHIVSVAITATQLWLLVRWVRTEHDGWLYALALFCGIGVTHHPITIWGLPAYAVFILMHRPKLLLQPKTLVPFIVFGLLGLLPWLYFPLRSPHVPFGPTDMRTWAGFLRHATAQGLRVNLFHFGLVDQIDRLRVFWTLLRLQYVWPLLVIMGLGGIVLVRSYPRMALLWGLFLLGHMSFTLNSVQDVMAYLLHIFSALAMPIGIGVWTLLRYAHTLAEQQSAHRFRWLPVVLSIALCALPMATLVHRMPRISLRYWQAADDFIENLWQRFHGQGESVAFVSDWEHLTPYFYHTYVEGWEMDPADLRPVYVTSAQPWPESVFAHLPSGPVYLSNYRRDIRELGFRLRPEGDLWRVLEPPALEAVTPQYPLHDMWVNGQVELLGYDIGITTVPQGAVVPLVLYGRVATTQTAILMPFAQLGEVEQRWTTDSRRLTPEWLPDEIIAERYEMFVPYTLPPGTYPLYLGYADMSTGISTLAFSNDTTALKLAEVQVLADKGAARAAKALEHVLTNIGNDVALKSAQARVALDARHGTWETPLALRHTQPLHLTLTWRVLARPRTSYTVFIHLIDTAGRPWMGHDYTPLGGAFPSYLWFPKWLEGQKVMDPYRLELPPEVPPGEYWLEVGMYEMGSVRRVPQFNFEGTMVGDRFILGPVVVKPYQETK